jgi:hypothetical protein
MPAVMEAVRNMNTEEKFLVINMLWRDIAASSEEYAPEWHFDVLREREQSLADGTSKLLDWSDVKAELQSQRVAVV